MLVNCACPCRRAPIAAAVYSQAGLGRVLATPDSRFSLLAGMDGLNNSTSISILIMLQNNITLNGSQWWPAPGAIQVCDGRALQGRAAAGSGWRSCVQRALTHVALAVATQGHGPGKAVLERLPGLEQQQQPDSRCQQRAAPVSAAGPAGRAAYALLHCRYGRKRDQAARPCAAVQPLASSIRQVRASAGLTRAPCCAAVTGASFQVRWLLLARAPLTHAWQRAKVFLSFFPLSKS
jgi:hypothetical protein